MLLRTLAIASTLALAAPAAYAAPEAPVAVETVKVKAPQQNQADASGYAEREKQDTKAADFQGGDMVVIGISGGAILVLLLLLLILA
jgi:hypothetical protein